MGGEGEGLFRKERERKWLGEGGEEKTHSEKMTMLSTYEKRPQ